MKLYSWNVNGLRAAVKNGFLDWFARQDADIVCIQEIKATPDQLEEKVLHIGKYHSYWHPAEKKGYSGVALYSRHEPLSVKNGLGLAKFDSEGRVIVAEYPDFVLINAYFPNTQREHTRLPYKLEFCKEMMKFCNSFRKKGKNLILCGDYNVAHKPIDLANPKQNENNAGFLPEERAWMDEFLGAGYIDTFRSFTKEGGHYTWWSYRPGVREKNIGWRIDYFCVNPEFNDRVKKTVHQTKTMGSDHCPVMLELKK